VKKILFFGWLCHCGDKLGGRNTGGSHCHELGGSVVRTGRPGGRGHAGPTFRPPAFDIRQVGESGSALAVVRESGEEGLKMGSGCDIGMRVIPVAATYSKRKDYAFVSKRFRKKTEMPRNKAPPARVSMLPGSGVGMVGLVSGEVMKVAEYDVEIVPLLAIVANRFWYGTVN
jgi:hypothetical protein